MENYREIITDIVLNSKDHPTAEKIFLRAKEQAPNISVATVYNNLKALTNKGIIKKIPMENSAERYDNVIPHAHMVCSECGKFSDTLFCDMTDELSKISGVPILTYDLKLTYICDSCKASDNCDHL